MKQNTWHRRGLVGVILALAVVVSSTSTAQAIPLFKFVGIVTDALNRPLVGVKVTDGTNAPVYTGADGRYALEESSLSTYTLRASRADTLSRDSERQTVTLPIDRTVDFTPPTKHLLYRLAATPSPSTVSTANGSATITLAITSYAPLPASTCVNVTDSRTGTAAAATYLQMLDAIRSSWRYVLTVPQGGAQGSFTLTTTVTDCATGTGLTAAAPAAYTVDNTAPTIDRKTLFPAEDGNTVFTNQWVQFTLTDTLAGVKASSIQATVTDRNDATKTWTPSKSITYAGNALIVRTASVPLNSGGQYRVDVTATDNALNPLSFSWNFRHINVAATPATAVIESSAGTKRSGNTWTFLPQVNVGAFEVTAGPTEHSGFGVIGQSVPLDGAYIEYSVLGIPSPAAYGNVYADGTKVTVFKQFMKAAEEPQLTIPMSGQTVRLQPLTVELPPGVTSAALKLDSTAVPIVPAANSECANPNVCRYLDALPYYIPEDFAEDLMYEVQRQGAVGLGQSQSFMDVMIPATDTVPEHHWQGASLDEGIVVTPYDEQVIAYLEGVSYPGVNAAPPVPSQHTQACSLFPCTYSASSAQSTESMRYKCIRIDGADAARTQDCRQFSVVIEPACDGISNGTRDCGVFTDVGNNTYRFKATMKSQLGYTDNRASLPNRNEELGVAWDDQTGWSWLSGWQSADFDVYWCDGDEYLFGERGAGRHYHVFQMIGSMISHANPIPKVDPYGVSYNTASQWRPSEDFLAHDVSPRCTSFYAQDDPYRIHSDAKARATTYYVEERAVNYQSQFNGTAVVSVGHVWSQWGYDWAIDVGVEAGTDGGSAGFGFEFKPEDKEKSSIRKIPYGYQHGH